MPGVEVGGGAKELMPMLGWWGLNGRPAPSPSSGGGGVFSRCLMNSGAAGAAGLYGSGAVFSGSAGFSGEACRSCCMGLLDGAPGGGGGGGKLRVSGVACVDAGEAAMAVGLAWESLVWPFWYAGSETAMLSSCWTTELSGWSVCSTTSRSVSTCSFASTWLAVSRNWFASSNVQK